MSFQLRLENGTEESFNPSIGHDLGEATRGQGSNMRHIETPTGESESTFSLNAPAEAGQGVSFEIATLPS